MSTRDAWDVDLAKLHYRIAKWGLGLFDINSQGHVVARAEATEIDLYDLSVRLRAHGVGLPVLVRFPHILQHLLSELYTAFEQAIASSQYASNFIAAYPIKVNQQASVIRHFHAQSQWPIAYEVGSKAELIACLGIIEKQNQIIICNGYKDEAYIRLALIGRLLGHEVVIVIESLIEFQHVLKLYAELNIQPVLGMRVRLASIAEGNWQNTGGKRSKFGLTTSEVLQLVKELKKHDAIECMRMLHFHMGSQIPCLQDIRAGVQEGMRFFTGLTKLGVEFTQLNVGGGLAVDYEGSNSTSYFSKSYSISDYANTIIDVVNSVCQLEGMRAPTIVCENGRIMTAYHAVLLTDVINAEYQRDYERGHDEKLLTSNQKLKLLTELNEYISAESGDVDKNFDGSKSYAKLMQLTLEIEKDFCKGKLLLEDKAQAEKIANSICKRLWKYKDSLSEDCKCELEEKFIEKYFCNFSLFQSTPDIWGLKQIFPILPLHQLNAIPQHKVRLHDLTCDSDGQIDRYVEGGSIKSYLSLHQFFPGQDYVLGLFLVGAYQEILGDLHNLFGDTNAVNIELTADGAYQICEEEPGDSIEEVLSYVHIYASKMPQVWLKKLDQMNVSTKTKELVLQELEACLKADTYLG